MILTRLEAVNWRNLRQVNVAMERRVFAVGPNAGGKSNFLDAFRFLSDLAVRGGGLFPAIEKRGGVRSLQCRAGEGDGFGLAVTLAGESATWRYAVGVRTRGQDDPSPVLKYERISKDGQIILERPDADDRADPVRMEQTFLENVTANGAFREIAAFFAGTIYRNLYPSSAREETRHLRGMFPGIPSDESLRSFLFEVMSAPADVRKNRIAKIEAALRLVVPQLKKLSLSKLDEDRFQFESMFEHWRPGEKLPQEHFSDGTLRLISILWALLESESLLLLEEPELSLHPSIARHLPGLIYRLKRQRPGQTVLTTHSAELLSDPGIDGREVLLFLPDEHGGVAVRSAADLPEVEALIDAGMSIGDVVLPRSQPPRVEELGFFQ